MTTSTDDAKQWEMRRKRQVRSSKAVVLTESLLERMTPNDRMRLAQRILVQECERGFSYADFQSAQAVEKYAKRARNALRGLSL